MKQLLQQYAASNLWANKIITEEIKQLTDEKINYVIISSFPSVYKTVLHMMEVENIWWERLMLYERATLTGWFNGDFKALSEKLLQLSTQWIDWVNEANETNIMHVFGYKNTRNESFRQPVYEVLLHLFNHQSYHRGQLVTMLRQLGVHNIPPTDFIVFARKLS